MRFFDTLKMALHNIFHNKSRTLLTILIVFVVGTLLMVLNIFVLAFNTNMDNVSKKVFNDSGTTYSFGSYYDYSNSGQNNYEYFTDAEINTLMEAVSNHTSIIDTFSVNMNIYGSCFDYDRTVGISANNMPFQEGMSITDTNTKLTFTTFSVGIAAEDDFLLDGRIWTASDVNTNSIWVSDKFTFEYYKLHNKTLKAGDKIVLATQEMNYGDNNIFPAAREDFVIRGIIDSDKILPTKGSYGSSATYQAYADFSYFNSKFATQINRFEMAFKPVDENYNFNTVYNEILDMYEEINNNPAVRQIELTGINAALSFLMDSSRFSVEIKTQMDIVRLIGVALQIFIIIICFVILLISAGSVANTIIISTDKNKKFIGLMKAMGLKNKGVNSIVNWEAAIQILIGIGVSFGILLLLQPVMLNAMVLLVGGIFKSMAPGVELTYVLPMPLYVPAIIFAVFLGMALLSARGSLVKLNKQDVIAIMSEVA